MSRFYKDSVTNLWVVDKRIGVPGGTCILTEHETDEVSIESIDGRVFLSRRQVTTIEKEDEDDIDIPKIEMY